MKSMSSLLVEDAKIVFGSPGIAAHATTAGDCDYVSLKGYDLCTIVMAVDNATSVTGCDVTLKQATAVAGTSEKALAFSWVWANADAGASDTLVQTAVTSNTFTTATTDNKNLVYVMQIRAEDLDVDNGFDCIRLDGLAQVNSVSSVMYILSGARYAKATPPSAIID